MAATGSPGAVGKTSGSSSRIFPMRGACCRGQAAGVILTRRRHQQGAIDATDHRVQPETSVTSRNRPMLIAAGTIALTVLAAGPAHSQQAATSNSATTITVATITAPGAISAATASRST